MASRRKLIKWYTDQQGRVSYSRDQRLGPKSYDGASAMFAALIYADYLGQSTHLGSLSTLMQMEGRLLQPIHASQVRRGDVFISKQAESKSSHDVEESHTGVALDKKRIILCCREHDGIHIGPLRPWSHEIMHWYRLAEPVRKRRTWIEKVHECVSKYQRRKALQALKKVDKDKKCYN